MIFFSFQGLHTVAQLFSELQFSFHCQVFAWQAVKRLNRVQIATGPSAAFLVMTTLSHRHDVTPHLDVTSSQRDVTSSQRDVTPSQHDKTSSLCDVTPSRRSEDVTSRHAQVMSRHQLAMSRRHDATSRRSKLFRTITLSANERGRGKHGALKKKPKKKHQRKNEN